jgi:anion-transporting  ArsA/GET3 family ATPase
VSASLLDKRLLFFTGKGGVGKSTIAAAFALLASLHGKRVLVVEVDAKGNLTDLFEHAPVGFSPTQVHPSVYALTMNTQDSLQEYLKLNLKVPVIGRIGPVARALDFVASAAPGVKEILTVGKIVWEVREALEGRADWDLVVVDAAATGHIVAQLGAPEAIRDLVSVGLVRSQTEWMSELLADPEICALNVVATPEEMPVNETIELVERAREELTVPFGAVIVNRVLPELFTRHDEELFDSLCEAEPRERLTAAAGPGTTAVLDGARLAVSLRRTRAVHLSRLRTTLELPMVYVPYLFVRTHGLRVTRMVADALGQEIA